MKKIILIALLCSVGVQIIAQQKHYSKNSQKYYVIVLSSTAYSQNGLTYKGDGQKILSNVENCYCTTITEDGAAILIDNFEAPYEMMKNYHFSEELYTFPTYKIASDFRKNVRNDPGVSGHIGDDLVMYGYIFSISGDNRYSFKSILIK